MAYHLIDIDSITRIFKSLKGLTGLHFSLLDDRGNSMIASPEEDVILSHIKKQKKARDNYKEFILSNVKLATKRREPFIAQSPSSQCHCFIPIQYRDVRMVILAEAFFLSHNDFLNYYDAYGEAHALNERSKEEWSEKILIIEKEKIKHVIRDIYELLENVMMFGYENKDLNKRLLWLKTMISLMADIKSGTSLKDIYEIVLDAIVFLFNVDTAVIYTSRNDHFRPEVCVGRNKKVLSTVQLPVKNYYIAKACATHTPLSVADSASIWNLGLPEEIISMQIIPITLNSVFFSFLGIFNTILERDALSSINELCKLTSHICSVRYINEKVKEKSETISLISSKTSELYGYFKDSDRLYGKVVDEAAKIIGAEKCSLMLPDPEMKYLKVAAVKGVKRVLMENMKVRIGEGIAGTVFKKGEPVLIDHESNFENYAVVPRTFFKTTSCLSVPLKLQDETIGILNFTDKISEKVFTKHDISGILPYIQQVSIMIKMSHLYGRSEHLQELSFTDSLTGLYNRRYFDIQLEEELRRSERYGLSFSLAIADIDDFKLFNDTEGHVAGDNILKQISSILIDNVRTHDILVRLGGEEFAIIMPQTRNSEAYQVAERIRKNVKERIVGFWKKFPRESLTISIGLAIYPQDGDTVIGLIERADKALYRAKREGKDRTVVFQGISKVSKDDDSGLRGGLNSRLWYL